MTELFTDAPWQQGALGKQPSRGTTMASPNNPKSCKQLIREHSMARVLRTSLNRRHFQLRPLSRMDAVEQVQRYR